MMTEKTQGDRLKQQIREHYAERAVAATSARKASCCASADPAPQPQDELARGLYALGELGELPDAAVLASLGCGNPTALAQLAPGEVVLDLGSGGGIDVLLSARRVGPGGKAYGLDMTDARTSGRRASTTSSSLRARSRTYLCPTTRST
jgi:arsenite methyltransferase